MATRSGRRWLKHSPLKGMLVKELPWRGEPIILFHHQLPTYQVSQKTPRQPGNPSTTQTTLLHSRIYILHHSSPTLGETWKIHPYYPFPIEEQNNLGLSLVLKGGRRLLTMENLKGSTLGHRFLLQGPVQEEGCLQNHPREDSMDMDHQGRILKEALMMDHQMDPPDNPLVEEHLQEVTQDQEE